MVELYYDDLNNLRKIEGRAQHQHNISAGDRYWPSYIDQHVAQLEFDTSMMDGGEQSCVFGSVIADAMNPSLISTDSLDMETLRARCENNKHNDYKLTFEDSGQWTTSGIGGSFTTNATASPPIPQSRRAGGRLLRNNRDAGGGAMLLPAVDTHNISLRLLEELNNEQHNVDVNALKWRNDILDELLNNNGDTSSTSQMNFRDTGMTNWGQLRNSSEMEPFNSEKVYSLPELNSNQKKRKAVAPSATNFSSKGFSSPAVVQSPPQQRKHQQSPLVTPAVPAPPPVLKTATNTASSSRPASSLVENFIDKRRQSDQLPKQQEPAPTDYQYSETYLGNGRYIDMNENEIGFVPPCTDSIQKGSSSGERELLDLDLRRLRLLGEEFTAAVGKKLRSGAAESSFAMSKPRRTFADLSSSQTAPDLKFIALAHKVPNICPSSSSMDNLLKRAREVGENVDELIDCCAASQRLLSDSSPDHAANSQTCAPDSGLGSTSSEGPSHIEDWPSLSVLLPRNVVDACSFFKSNSFLLTGSSNNIEAHQRRSPPRSFTSAGIRHLQDAEQQRPATACHACLGGLETDCADCANFANIATTKSAVYFTRTSPRLRDNSAQKLRLHSKELAMIGLPIYDQKRNVVERVVEGVAEIIRGASSMVLLAALERLFNDELLAGVRPWNVICKITGQGPVTRNIFALIQELEASEKPENSRVHHFFRGLLGMHSLDGWLSYVVLKEQVLAQLYAQSAFLLGAQSTYRSLFWRLMESVELLSVLNQCGSTAKRWDQRSRKTSSSATTNVPPSPSSTRLGSSTAARLHSDSRVPKSSSVPTKLSKNAEITSPDEQRGEEKDGRIPEVCLEVPEEELAEAGDGDLTSGIAPSCQLKPSRIPVFRSRSRSNNSSAATSYFSSRSRSSGAHRFPAPICPVKGEATTTTNAVLEAPGTMLPLGKGEPVRVLSVRGAYSRCSRLQHHLGGLLAIRNGVVPTNRLDFGRGQ